MENITTEQYAVIISDSITNGQRQQGVRQFKEALADSVNAQSLLMDIYNQLGADDAIWLASKIIENEKP